MASASTAIQQEKYDPLFRFDYTVFQGRAPNKYSVLGFVNVHVFETSAKVYVFYTKWNDYYLRTCDLPTYNRLDDGMPFRGEILHESSIIIGNRVTQEQKAAFLEREEDKTTPPLQFPEVEKIDYSVKDDQIKDISDVDKICLLEMIQRAMAIRFPSIKPQITEQEKKTN